MAKKKKKKRILRSFSFVDIPCPVCTNNKGNILSVMKVHRCKRCSTLWKEKDGDIEIIFKFERKRK